MSQPDGPSSHVATVSGTPLNGIARLCDPLRPPMWRTFQAARL
jgi:hypothetical protein